MNAKKVMDVFSLRDHVVSEYERFATSFTTIHAEDIRRQVDIIYARGKYWPEPLIQINPSYERASSIGELIEAGQLAPQCADIFRTPPTESEPRGAPLSLYKHQEEAIVLANGGESYVVTTGTGSGKSLCFFIPIVSAILAEKSERRGGRTRAIVIYPMNALANSQLEELDKFVDNAPGDKKPVTFARYTGQESDADRRRVADEPPDILLTNFMMLELLMTRQDTVDRKVIENCEGLRFLVLDELHTYRGRQGADVALLVRRVRERLSSDLQCIGTSATMASEGTRLDKNSVVAGVASKLFSTNIKPENVIGEALERVTEPIADAKVLASLGAAIDAGVPADVADAALRSHPLAIWVETRLGLSWSAADHCWVRARPRTVTEAVTELGRDARRGEAECRKALQNLLLVSSTPEAKRTGKPGANARSFFAFKLHQFVSGAGHAFATFEPPGRRVVSVEGQQYWPGDDQKRLYAVHFCRKCGHEYHPVRLVTKGPDKCFLPRDIDDAALPKSEAKAAANGPPAEAGEGEELGFLTPHARDDDFTFSGEPDDFPETWLEEPRTGGLRLKASYRNAKPRPYDVAPSGQVGAGMRAWFLPGRFRFCLRCRDVQSSSARDRNRLASLSAEGRSSATTVLVASTLRWMHGDQSGLEAFTRKLLGFTDNRQDAALQSGHFNDFLFVSLLRAGFLGALELAGAAGVRSEDLGRAMQEALGFDRPGSRAEWLLEPSLKGFNLQEAESTLREALAYRAWFDQRRGWRYTSPNLEQLGLVEIDYLGLDDLARDDANFADAPDLLRDASPTIRSSVYRVLLDHLRQSMAVGSRLLKRSGVEQLRDKSHAHLRPPWGFGDDEQPSEARWLFVSGQRDTSPRDEDRLVARGGSRSALGKLLKSSKLWGGNREVRKLSSAEIDKLIGALLGAARESGLTREEPTPFGEQLGWKLNDACVVFRRGEPKPGKARSNENPFFREFYAELSRALRQPGHPLFGFEAREHTAQVEAERRALREKRFRYGEKERKELESGKGRREGGEGGEFLPVLFCSPTMELGVDISALNAVYLRNVPPTPANYAQRSGRAGRSGQAAFVLTYCSAQGPHDQYFFREPGRMVHGEVRSPLLDLTNRDLIDSHLSAVWLACTKVELAPSIADLLALNDLGWPLRPELREALGQPQIAELATERIERVLAHLEAELSADAPPWYQAGRRDYAVTIARTALDRFDRAFDRWRNLFKAAEQQRDASRRTMDNHSTPQREKDEARKLHSQALDQLDLLKKGASGASNDFNTYRYLATEGFLPGYNFPRLPLMAYVPAASEGRGRQTYLQRPRFLALAEFGPRSLVYHEGRAFRVVRALLALGHREGTKFDARLPTQSVRICRECGAGHFDDESSLCDACEASLGDAEIVGDVYRIENVATQPAERITSNDEERQRQGFELQTTFRWATRDRAFDVRRGAALEGGAEVARLAYGPGSTITRLNLGLRRRAKRKVFGFKLDPISGYWAKNEDEPEEVADPTKSSPQRIVPSVQDRKNALLLQPGEGGLSQGTLATLQYALLRGVEARFQLEEGEVLAESMPTRDERKGFLFYEATEGGAGVLSRLVTESDKVAEVAREALRIMHYLDEGSALPDDPLGLTNVDPSCVAACYRCLMSYYNQPDHEIIDRRDRKVKELLWRLARSTVERRAVRPSERPAQRPSAPPGSNPVLVRWHELAKARELPAPDREPLVEGEARLPLVWRAQYVVAAFGGVPAALVGKLVDRGFEVIMFENDESTWAGSFERLATFLRPAS